jgi:hypothetical protein
VTWPLDGQDQIFRSCGLASAITGPVVSGFETPDRIQVGLRLLSTVNGEIT